MSAYHTSADVGHGSPLPGWPPFTLEGLFEALERWTLDPTWELLTPEGQEVIPQRYDTPYWGAAWAAKENGYRVTPDGAPFMTYVTTRPIVPGHPLARSYTGNFLAVSLGFNIVTDDPALWERLDAAIAANMARPEWAEAAAEIKERRANRWKPAPSRRPKGAA